MRRPLLVPCNRGSSIFERLISNPPKNIDGLLLEGSSLGRVRDDKRFPTEKDIEDLLTHAFRDTEVLALVNASAQNIGRVVSIFRACRKTGRKLVVDLYAAAILQGWWVATQAFSLLLSFFNSTAWQSYTESNPPFSCAAFHLNGSCRKIGKRRDSGYNGFGGGWNVGWVERRQLLGFAAEFYQTNRYGTRNGWEASETQHETRSTQPTHCRSPKSVITRRDCVF